MAILKVKSTYSMDAETVRTLDSLAHRWKVTKSEALRRAIRIAAAKEPPGRGSLLALDEAQQSMRLASKVAAAWLERVRRERRAASRRGEGTQ
jgi:hypothetical protein